MYQLEPWRPFLAASWRWGRKHLAWCPNGEWICADQSSRRSLPLDPSKRPSPPCVSMRALTECHAFSLQTLPAYCSFVRSSSNVVFWPSSPLRVGSVVKALRSHPRRRFTFSPVVVHPLSRSPYSTPLRRRQPSERHASCLNFRQEAMAEGSSQVHKPGPPCIIISRSFRLMFCVPVPCAITWLRLAP